MKITLEQINKNHKFLNILSTIFMIFFLITIIIYIYICLIGLDNKVLSNSIMDDSKLINFNTGWVDKENNPINLNPFISNKIFNNTLEANIYHRIPDTIKPGDSLCFRTLSSFVTMYIDGKKVLITPYKKMLFSCESPGSVWSFYEFKESDIGKTIKLNIKLCYNDSSCYIEEMYVGNSSYYLAQYISKKMASVIICLIVLFLGILFIVADLYMNFSRRLKNHTLLYIGLLAFVVSIWCLFSTHVVELIPGTSQSIQYISCVFLFLIPYTALCFVKNAFNVKYDLFININLSLILVLYFVATILQLTGIADYHETLILTHISLGTGILTSVLSLIFTYKKSGLFVFKFETKKKRFFFKAASILVISLLMVSVIFDMILFYNGDQVNVGVFTRFSVIFVILYLALITGNNLYSIAKQLNETNAAKELAYKDILTGIPNRTAFIEKLDELESEILKHKKIAIISFDVNNLKYVNDTYGHSIGDDLIISAAKTIEKTLSSDTSTLYRIGGDEFVAIIDSTDADILYKTFELQFKVNIQNFNNFYDKKYTLSIAYGCAIYDVNKLKSNHEISLSDILKESDKQMYKNKIAMK